MGEDSRESLLSPLVPGRSSWSRQLRNATSQIWHHSYADKETNYRFNMISHLVKRGHEGRVNCINASQSADYIVTGGEDHTLRIWGYDASRIFYDYELGGFQWRGYVYKEADEPVVLDHCSYPLTHLLQVAPLDEDGRADRSQQRPLWVVFNNQTFCDENGNLKVAFKTTVTHEASDSYMLVGVLMHDVEHTENRELVQSGLLKEEDAKKPFGVTAVACAGKQGPCISGTSNGSLHFVKLSGASAEVSSIRDFGIGRINDIHVAEVNSYEDADLYGPWQLAVAGEGGFVKFVQLHVTANELFFEVDEELLQHQGPVLKARLIGEEGPFGVRLASCALQEVYLWGDDGALLTTLSLGEVPVVEDLTVTHRDSGSLLFAGKDGTIGVWVIDPSAEELQVEPLTIYRYRGKGIDVDQGSDLAEYAVHVRDENVVVCWDLLAARPECLMRPESLSKWWELLIRPGKEKFVAEMVHQSPVTDFKVVEDDIEGPVLISASSDGTVYTWAMRRTDRGEICAQMRSLKLWEVALPPALLAMTVFQLCSFAFGPSTEWHSGVKKTVRYGANILLFGTELSLEFSLKASDKFWWQCYIVTRIMVIFLVCEIAGAHEALTTLQHWLQSSQRYKAAELLGSTSRMHVLRRLLGGMQTLLSLMTWFCCTVGVAPLFKVCGQAMRCSQGDDGRFYLDVTGGKEVECGLFLGVPVTLTWKGFTSWGFSPLVVLLISLVYLVGLLPYAVVGGDNSYVQRDEVLDWSRWQFNAERKATALYLGVFHPNPRNVFLCHVVELVSKALLPLITWLVAQPLLQMLLSTCLMAALYAESKLFPPFLDEMYCAVVQGSRLFALCTMSCGLLTVVLGPGKGSDVPLLLLLVSLVCVGSRTAYRAMRATSVRAQRGKVFRKATSERLD